MKTKEFQKQINESRILFAIREAERKTSGEIRIMISDQKVQDPVQEAQKIFVREKMDRTRERNAVLIWIAPVCQKFAVIGDQGIHEKVGNEFWSQMVQKVGEAFKKGCFTEGLVQAIETVGEGLAKYFPRKTDDQNELSDRMMRG